MMVHLFHSSFFSVSEAGVRANPICLSMAETAKSKGVNFYEYIKILLSDLPNLGIHQNPEILDQTCSGQK